MDDIRLTINSDLTVTIYNFNTENSFNMTLVDSVEHYYKNSRIKIREIVVDKDNLTQSEKALISCLKQHDTVIIGDTLEDSNKFDIFEAQIIIPYRARGVNSFRKCQMHNFIKHMNEYLGSVYSEMKYKLIIVEQNNDHMFNRGILINIGYLEREKNIDYKIKYYIHHNCDLFPYIKQDPKLDYTFTPINEVRDIFGYSGGIGGIAVFNRLTFSMIKGFPNDYFSWGAEDTTLHKRCEMNSIYIKRPLYNVGILEEPHARDSSFNHINQLKKSRDNPATNGLDTCKYSCKINNETDFDYKNVIHYLVDFDYINIS